MAILPINGYNNTGHTEPFKAPVPITTGTALAQDYSGFGITPSIALEYTEWGKNEPSATTVNQGLFCVSIDAFDGVTTILTSHNSLKPGMIVDDGTTFLEVVSVRTLPMSDGPTQEIVFSGNVTGLTAGMYLFAVGKTLDVGAITATRNYAAGEIVVELMPRVGTYVA